MGEGIVFLRAKNIVWIFLTNEGFFYYFNERNIVWIFFDKRGYFLMVKRYCFDFLDG
jgi:hypothetical protein